MVNNAMRCARGAGTPSPQRMVSDLVTPHRVSNPLPQSLVGSRPDAGVRRVLGFVSGGVRQRSGAASADVWQGGVLACADVWRL